MSTSIKSFGRGRAAGLVLIALVGLGLAYLHFAGGSASVSVPSARMRDSRPLSTARTGTSRPTAARSSSLRTGMTRTRA